MESFSNDVHGILRELNEADQQANEIVSVMKTMKKTQ